MRKVEELARAEMTLLKRRRGPAPINLPGEKDAAGDFSTRLAHGPLRMQQAIAEPGGRWRIITPVEPRYPRRPPLVGRPSTEVLTSEILDRAGNRNGGDPLSARTSQERPGCPDGAFSRRRVVDHDDRGPRQQRRRLHLDRIQVDA